MNSEELRSIQAPLKEKYRNEPDSAVVTLQAEGKIGEGISCKVETGRAISEAGLHPATGGDGSLACSGDLLLEALVSCAGVTLSSVATAIGIELKNGTVKAEGDLDFKGTLAVSKEVPVGFRNICLSFELDCDADEEQQKTLLKLTERYCVVLQTITAATPVNSEIINSR
ncbi:OsmC family protein [Draconibacterium sp. IB214405]|uniref:OsmC family protein n=1 Tax=Draconibacterium sp. IB214405 TaxID=3097352 RepID=UPI002A12924E|nr:OsmC family protein [Draconibacterium sp. IB214405]MDX8337882.1 OsmC family protein [Draconibacterium sp. IB214405]